MEMDAGEVRDERQEPALQQLREAALLTEPPKPGYELVGFFTYLVWLPIGAASDDDVEAKSLTWVPADLESRETWGSLYMAVAEHSLRAVGDLLGIDPPADDPD